MSAELSRGKGVEHIPDLLRRVRRTTPLGGLNPSQRKNMVKGAFDIHPKHHASMRGRHVALVDDVYTSGATTDACVRVLKKAGAAKVTILCWARVLPQGLEINQPGNT
jgi:predicted amidophosphoribosyltransferase